MFQTCTHTHAQNLGTRILQDVPTHRKCPVGLVIEPFLASFVLEQESFLVKISSSIYCRNKTCFGANNCVMNPANIPSPLQGFGDPTIFRVCVHSLHCGQHLERRGSTLVLCASQSRFHPHRLGSLQTAMVLRMLPSAWVMALLETLGRVSKSSKRREQMARKAILEYKKR